MNKFDQAKQQTLANIYVDHLDFSPKGSIDLPVRELVWIINQHSSYYTTSSCSGRVSLSVPLSHEENKGVRWLFVKHGYITLENVHSCLTDSSLKSDNLLTIRCEPFIMHIACKSIESGQKLHQVALESGFRESGLTLGTTGKVMLAIRSTAFTLETPLALNGTLLLKEEYLHLLINEINRRMKGNFDRIHQFFCRLKKNWNYPVFQLSTQSYLTESETSRLGILHNHWKRWGHCVSTVSDGSWVMSGGQGIENAEGVKSSRNTSTIVVTPQKTSLKSLIPSIIDEFPKHVHGQLNTLNLSLPDGTILSLAFLSGGRLSPMQSLPCLNLFNIKSSTNFSKFLAYKEVGDVPEPRWGHSLLPLQTSNNPSQTHTFVLFGGRNQKQIFDEFYTLTITMSDIEREGEQKPVVCCSWKRVELQYLINNNGGNTQIVATSPLRRLFQAACVLSMDLETINIINQSQTSIEERKTSDFMIFIHGGITSLSNPIPLDDSYLIDLNNFTISAVSLSVSIPRFGHTLTVLDGKCLLLVGGMSSMLGASDEIVGEENASYILDYDVTYSLVETFGSSRDLQVQIRSVDYKSAEDGKRINVLPCQRCRCHHQVLRLSDDERQRGQCLYVIGGGAMTLAFGNHYCQPVKLSVLGKNFDVTQSENKLNKSSTPSLHISSSNNETSEKSKTLKEKARQGIIVEEKGVKSDDLLCYLCVNKKEEVKAMKTWLEKYGYYNKQSKITNLNSTSLTKESNTLERLDLRSLEVSTVPLSELPTNFISTLSGEKLEGSEMMMIPINKEGYQKLIETIDKSLIQSLLQIYDYTSLLALRSDVSEPSRTGEQRIIFGEKGANQYLLSLAQGNHELKEEIPVKYEFVGDVMLIPDNSLLSTDWLRLSSNELWIRLAAHFPKVTRIGRKALIEKSLMRQSQIDVLHVTPAYQEMVRRVKVKKPLCDCGKKHYEEISEENTIQDLKAYGWVTLTENRIKFSFDITKVMFCSGNVTERMRMEKLGNIQSNEVIFDLYCGIGYYTVPLLVYHGKKIQAYYACEWNPNSILALRHNLTQNHILPSSNPPQKSHHIAEETSQPIRKVVYDFSAHTSELLGTIEEGELKAPLTMNAALVPLSERVKVLYGNNAISTACFEDCADRVLLGLLPSSENGWEIAIRLLNRVKGGMLHLHENVLEKDLSSFIHDRLLVKLKQHCDKYGKSDMTITIIHVEKVKSYSPHVNHYVFDIFISPQG